MTSGNFHLKLDTPFLLVDNYSYNSEQRQVFNLSKNISQKYIQLVFQCLTSKNEDQNDKTVTRVIFDA